jgi:hypothetical protein
MSILSRALKGLGIDHSASRPEPQRNKARLALETLEDRMVPAAPVSLGDAGQFAVLGLRGTQINDGSATITGNEGVSRGGVIQTSSRTHITGNVDEFARREFRGRGHVGGHVVVDAALMTQADADALAASAQAAALKATQTLGTVRRATTITGNGGLNVIDINGSIRASLTLSGGANDVFVVNVTGNLSLSGSAALGLAGGVTANHVLYNFIGRHGQISTGAHDAVNGTLLGVHYNFNVGGTVNGELIGGGRTINLGGHATITQVNFKFPDAAPASLSGVVVSANSGLGMGGVTMTLTGTDDQGHPVSLTTTTAADGTYKFTGLRPGTYTLTETPPPPSGGFSFEQTTAKVGTVNGAADGSLVTNNRNQIAGITLAAGNNGVGYAFTDLYTGS